MFTNLVKTLQDYVTKINGYDKQKYAVLARCLSDDDFVRLLDENTKRGINDLQNILERNDRDFAWVRENRSDYVGAIDSLYFNALAFEVSKTRNISHFEQKTTELEKRITHAQQNIEHINGVAELISGATILAEYAKKFDSQAKKHGRRANWWLLYTCMSIAGLVALVGLLLFFQISEFAPLMDIFADDIVRVGNVTAVSLVIKAALVFGYLQIPYFLKRNYFAEKHLQQANIHRGNVLNTLHAVYIAIQDQKERDKIIVTGSAIAFSEAESGYITRKEGAGGDDLTETLITKMWKS